MNEPPPPGCEWRWKPDRAWELTSWPCAGRCRWTDQGVRCAATAVALLDRRRSTSSRHVWWAYCADHMFGRVIIDGVVYSRYAHELSRDLR